MRRYLLLAAILAFIPETILAAPPRPHLEMVRGLRTNGLPDLALEYLDELKASNPPPEIAVLLPLEYARVHLALANRETDEVKRNEMLGIARTEFDTFINGNPTHPQTPYANIDVARLNGLRGKMLVSKARWTQNPKRQDLLNEAKKLFMVAAEKYKNAIDAIDKQPNKTPQLESLALAAKLDQAINLFDMALTYGNEPAEIEKRGKDLNAAKKIVEKVMVQNDKDPMSWVARAWLAQIAYELDDDIVAKAELDNLILKQRTNPRAEAGVRVALYFRVLHGGSKIPPKGETPKQRLQRTIDDATTWLNTYRSYRNTTEGLGALYIRATKRFELAATEIVYDKTDKSKIVSIPASAVKIFDDAEKDFKELMESENEYSEQAQQFRTQILVTLADQVARTGELTPELLGNFEKCFLEAQVQLARLEQFKVKKSPAPTPEQVKTEENTRYRTAIRFLEYALSHTGPLDPVKDVTSAQTYLISCHYRLQHFQQAAILAEYISRSNPRSPKAMMMAQNAIQCYTQSYLAAKSLTKVPEDLDADMERSRQMARFIVATWPNDPGSDFSRHMIAQNLTRDKKYDAALPLYMAIRTGYPNLLSARQELSGVLFNIVKPVDETNPILFNQKAKDRIKQWQSDWDKTIAMLKELPVPGEDANETTIGLYSGTMSNLALLYQLDGKFAEAKLLGESLLANLEKWKSLKGVAKENLFFSAKTIVYNALRSEALDNARQKNYIKVAEILNPIIEQIQKELESKKESTEAPKSYRDSQRQLIVIALQSAVQDQKIDRAGELLDVLEKSGGSTEGNFSMMQSLVGTIRGQLEELRKDPKTNAEEIKSLSTGFKQFLNQIAPKSDGIKNTAGKIDMKLFLAQGYNSVDAFAEATKLLKPLRDELKTFVPPPDAKESIDKKKKQIDFALARNYRSGKQFDEAESLFKEIVGPPTAIKNPAQRGWGFTSLDVRKEYAVLKEDIAFQWTKTTPSKAVKWKEAIDEWAAVKTLFVRDIPPVFNPNAPGVVNAIHFMAVGGSVIGRTNPIVIELAREINKKAEAVAKKRTAFFDIFLDQMNCNLRAYYSIDPVKYETQIAKSAQTLIEFQAKNTDIGPDQIARIAKIYEQFPAFQKKVQAAKQGTP